jgi:hypothetical protein
MNRHRQMRVEIKSIQVLPVHLLTQWRVLESEEDGRWVTRFLGIGNRRRMLVISPPIRRFDPDTACGLATDGEVWLLFPGEHAGKSKTGYESTCDASALFVEAIAIPGWRQKPRL